MITITFGPGGDYPTLTSACAQMTNTDNHTFQQVGNAPVTETSPNDFGGSYVDMGGAYGITIKGNFQDIILTSTAFFSSSPYWYFGYQSKNISHFILEDCSFKYDVTPATKYYATMFNSTFLSTSYYFADYTSLLKVKRCRFYTSFNNTKCNLIDNNQTGITCKVEMSQCLFYGGFQQITNTYPYNSSLHQGSTYDHITFIAQNPEEQVIVVKNQTYPNVLISNSYFVNLQKDNDMLLHVLLNPTNTTIYDLTNGTSADHPDNCVYDYSDSDSVYWLAPTQTGSLFSACSELAFDDVRYYNGTTYDASVTNHIRGGNGVSVELPAPTDVVASKGTHTDKIAITWTEIVESTSAIGYEIYRTSAGDDILNFDGLDYLARVPLGTSAYDDTTASTDSDYWYRLKTYR